MATAARGLLGFLQQQIACSDYSVLELQRLSGVSQHTIRRYLQREHFTELQRIERVLATLGVLTAGRDRSGVWVAIPLVGEAAEAPVAVRPASVAAPPDGLAGAIRQLAVRSGWNAYRLHRASGVSYAAIRGLLARTAGRVATHLIALLAVVGAELHLAVAGEVMALTPPAADRERGRHLHARACAASRRYQQSRRADAQPKRRRRPGVCAISTARMVALYEVDGLTAGDIARVAGVSARRVRQILAEAGCVAHRRRAIVRRQAAAQG